MDWMALLQHRWTIPALAELERRDGAKFVTLVYALEASRSAMRETLDALLVLGLVARNPGYGHPLRPEYVLTAAGRSLGQACVDIAEAVAVIGAEETAYRKWSLPIVRQLSVGSDRFGQLRDEIDGLTPRALSSALKSLVRAGMVERAVDDSYPPVSRYGLTESSVVIVAPLARLAERAASRVAEG